jgi:hypothetical protein
MGFAISWIAVRQKSPDAVIQELRLSRTGEFGDYADYPIVAQSLRSGWFLMVIDECDHKLLDPGELQRLSLECEVIACSIEEHVMYSSSECWKNGKEIWRVRHNAQESILDLESTGNLPENFPDLTRQFADEQEQAGGETADVDFYFEIPLQTARSVVGFKHDETNPEIDDECFEILAPLPSSAMRTADVKPWWQFW